MPFRPLDFSDIHHLQLGFSSSRHMRPDVLTAGTDPVRIRRQLPPAESGPMILLSACKCATYTFAFLHEKRISRCCVDLPRWAARQGVRCALLVWRGLPKHAKEVSCLPVDLNAFSLAKKARMQKQAGQGTAEGMAWQLGARYIPPFVKSCTAARRSCSRSPPSTTPPGDVGITSSAAVQASLHAGPLTEFVEFWLSEMHAACSP